MCDPEKSEHDPKTGGRLSNLALGQRVSGEVVAVPKPGTIGIFVDIGLFAEAFVDVLLLPDGGDRWPGKGEVMDFLVWWISPDRSRIRLVPLDPRFRHDDFYNWLQAHPPGGLDPSIWLEQLEQ
jgi:hypothetical protein